MDLSASPISFHCVRLTSFRQQTSCLNEVIQDTGLIEFYSLLNLLEDVSSFKCNYDKTKNKILIDGEETEDGCFQYISEKIISGNNILVEKVNSGCEKKLRISKSQNEEFKDQKVKATIQDSASYLFDSLGVSNCISFKLINTGLDEQLTPVINFECLLQEISKNPLLCELIKSCICNPAYNLNLTVS